jgi:hypothetical protein
MINEPSAQAGLSFFAALVDNRRQLLNKNSFSPDMAPKIKQGIPL